MSETEKQPKLLVLMGVSGCGKSTFGTILETTKGWRFLDGDDFHTPANKKKMGAGIPLTDEDRWPWFDVLRAEVIQAIHESGGKPVTLACSALKRSYRDYLLADVDDALLVYLHGSKSAIFDNVSSREHEYMQPSLLDSQFEALEEPNADEENVLALDIEAGVPSAMEKLEAFFAKSAQE